MNETPVPTADAGCEESAASRPRGWHILLLLLVCGGLYLLRAGALPLADPEESRCALIVRDILERGHWLMPRLQGRPYFDKPAPFFWAAAAGVKLTGSAELGGRMVPAVAGALAVLVAYGFARVVFADALAGLLAGLVLATSGEFLFMARWYRMDMPFVAAMWAALWWFWRWEDRRLRCPAVSRSGGWLGFYLFCAVATLFKGPAGLGLPVLVVLAYFLLSRQYRRVAEFFSPVGIAAYLLVAAPWYVAVSAAEPGYAKEFFLRQNIQRFTGSARFGHHWPGILYVPIVLVGMLPWTIFLPGIVIRYFPRWWKARNDRPGLLFLWLCALVPLVFFAASGTKLVSYVLPVFPPLAVMVGGLVATWVISHRPDGLMRLGARALLVAVALLPVVPLAVEVWLGAADAWLLVPFALAGSGFVAMLRALRRPRRGLFVGLGVAVVVGTFAYLIVHTAPAGYRRMSARALARTVQASVRRGARVCFWSKAKHSFLFYAALEDAPKLHASKPEDLEVLVKWLRSARPVYCLVSGRKRLARLLTRLRRACPGG